MVIIIYILIHIYYWDISRFFSFSKYEQKISIPVQRACSGNTNQNSKYLDPDPAGRLLGIRLWRKYGSATRWTPIWNIFISKFENRESIQLVRNKENKLYLQKQHKKRIWPKKCNSLTVGVPKSLNRNPYPTEKISFMLFWIRIRVMSVCVQVDPDPKKPDQWIRIRKTKAPCSNSMGV